MEHAESLPEGARPASGDECGETEDAGEAKREVYTVAGMEIGQDPTEFRNYEDNQQTKIVREHYRAMRSHQCVDFVDRMYAKWHTFDKAEMTIREAFDVLEGYVDSSDPDITLPNVVHAFQTAEAARAAGEPDWFVLTAFIHDMGKLMFKWGSAKDGQQGTLTGPQWALGGDTWVVGVPLPASAVLPEFNALNPDAGKYTSPCGMYKPGCGLKHVKFAYGHDEYLYRMLLFNKAALPEEALAIVRYHSCYPWHQHNEYKELEAPGDADLKVWVKRFNRYDLYTKCEDMPPVEELWPVYQALIDKYLPGKLKW